MSEDPSKEVKLDKQYRIFVRDDDGRTVVGFEDIDSIPVDEETGEILYTVDDLHDYGTSTTYTWVVGKYYEHDDAETLLDKFVKKELNTNE